MQDEDTSDRGGWAARTTGEHRVQRKQARKTRSTDRLRRGNQNILAALRETVNKEADGSKLIYERKSIKRLQWERCGRTKTKRTRFGAVRDTMR